MAKRPDALKLPSLAKLGADYGSWQKLCPTLAEWVCDACYDDESAKGDVTLTLRRRDGVMSIMLKVEDGGVCLHASGDSPDDALVAVELLLGMDPVPWERDKWPLNGGRKKSKKGG